ncbi:MAG: cytochrome c, partial [Burkholderiales bacterium]|nr:cytochrome c [Burkholderiales bacterium]
MRALRPVFAVIVFAAAQVGFAQSQQSQIQRGEYLARAGDCISCHTAAGGEPFAGGLRLDTPFGYMLSPNITPDHETGIGRWSRDHFHRALHHGVNRRGQDMYPTMPYDFYTKVTREDVDALWAYLRTVKPVRNAVVVNHLDFPFNVRMAMGVWRELYFKEGTYRRDPSKSQAWNRGAYLVEGLGHCSDCHSPRNLLGGIEKRKQFSGATIDGWFALDLTSDIATGLGDWSIEELAAYFKTGVAKGKATTLGPMAEVIRNSLSHLTDDDRRAMAEYLKLLPPDSTIRTGRVAPDPTRVRGAQLYTDNCSGCHQSRGRGVPGVFPALAGNPVVLAADPNDIIKVVDRGIKPRANYVAMPAFNIQLTPQEVAEIANYVRSSWGNNAAPNATSAMVAKLRAG